MVVVAKLAPFKRTSESEAKFVPLTVRVKSAVDILAACDTPIYASAEGMIDEVGAPSKWNDGMGGYVKIKHQLHEVETIYAHTSTNLVEVGDLVKRGDKIAEVGNTGEDAQGPSGCHVSFDVVGAKNPFAK